jgi:hypothetical protein
VDNDESSRGTISHITLLTLPDGKSRTRDGLGAQKAGARVPLHMYDEEREDGKNKTMRRGPLRGGVGGGGERTTPLR